MKALSERSMLWLLWGGRQMMSTWFSRAKVRPPGSLCVNSARLVLRYKNLILSALYVWWNEETTGWKSLSVSTPRNGTRGLVQAVFHSSVLVAYIFLEIQVTEEWSVQLVSYRWRMSQEISDLRIEEKISDACPSILIFSCVCAVQ
jgi:hypothetical protein